MCTNNDILTKYGVLREECLTNNALQPTFTTCPIRIASSPLPYHLENKGLYIQGAAGSGKSQVIKQMIYDIRNRGGEDKLIIYDVKPEYLPIFYRAGDTTICPTDRQNTPWNLFSIRNWIRSSKTKGQALFLVNSSTYTSDHQSFCSSFIDLVMQEILSLPDSTNRRIWLFIDELGSLLKLDLAVRFLKEGQKKGACTVLGTQDTVQIQHKYENNAQDLIYSCKSKVFARITSKNEKKHISEMISIPQEVYHLPDLNFLCQFGDAPWFTTSMEYVSWDIHNIHLPD